MLSFWAFCNLFPTSSSNITCRVGSDGYKDFEMPYKIFALDANCSSACISALWEVNSVSPAVVFFVCTKFTIMFSLICFWKYLVEPGQSVVCVLAFFQLKHPAVTCVGVIILVWTLFWLLDVLNAPGSTWQQLIQVQVISVCFWSGNWLWEGRCISFYFIMWKQGICLDFCVLLFRAAGLLSAEWTGGGRWGGATWSLMFCGASVVRDAVQCNTVQ